MMIASRAFRAGRAAELRAEDDERVVEQAALLQVLAAGRRSADRPASTSFVVIVLDVGVRVPFAAAAAAVEELHEAHAALDEPPRDEAVLAESFASPA